MVATFMPNYVAKSKVSIVDQVDSAFYYLGGVGQVSYIIT